MRRTTAVMMAVSLVAALAPAAPAAAGGNVALTWVPGSTVKVEQLIGDCDYTAQAKTGLCMPTTSRTLTRAKVVGTDLGASFESQGKLIFLFGDTLGPATAQNYFASDTIASTVSTDPAAGLALDFFTNPDGTPYFIRIPGVPMGAANVPHAGIRLGNTTYVVCNTGADINLPDPSSKRYSVLTRFDEAARRFTSLRTTRASFPIRPATDSMDRPSAPTTRSPPAAPPMRPT